MSHEQESQTSIEEIAAKAAAKFNDIDANSGLILDEVRDVAWKAYGENLLIDPLPSTREMIEGYIVKRVKSSASSRQSKLKRVLQSHQPLLALGVEFDSIVLVCGPAALGEAATDGRMTTLGLLTANDLRLIGSESRINRKQVEDADDKLQDGIRSAVPHLQNFIDYQDYCAHAGREQA